MSNTGKIVLGSIAVLGVAGYAIKKAIDANNLESQISFSLSNIKGNASLDLIKKGRIEIATTLRIINGSSISIPFSISQCKVIYKDVEIAVSKPDANITLGANSIINKTLTFEVPLTSLGIQSDLIVDLAKSIFSKGGLSEKINSIMSSITPNISISVTAKANGVAINFVKKLEGANAPAQIALTAQERDVVNGQEYNKYFKKSARTNITLNRDGDVPDVVNTMVQIVETHYQEAMPIAQILKGSTTLETARNTWNFAVRYLRYHNDRFGVEELRTPARSWYDGQINYVQNGQSESGIDCDDFSIFCGSVFRCLNIPFTFRITKYYYRDYFQHVYVYIPKGNNGKDIICDPVVDTFNYEKPYTEQEDDFDMKGLNIASSMNGLGGIPIQILEGIDGDTDNTIDGMSIELLEGYDTESDLYHVLNGTDFDVEGIDGVEKSEEDAVYQYLLRTRKVIASNPKLISAYTSKENEMLSMFDKAIAYYYTPQRDAVLEALAKYEDSMFASGKIYGLGLGDNEQFEGFFKKVAKVVKKGAQAQLKIAKKIGKGVVKVAKVVLVKFNPLFIAIRNGMLLMMKLNMFHMATKMKYGFLTEQQAKDNNIDIENWKKAVTAKNKLMSIFTKMGGKEANMQKAILKGKNVKAMMEVPKKDGEIKGLGELGEPYSAATIATAMGVMSPVIALCAKLSAGAKAVKDIKDAKDNITSLVPSSVKSSVNNTLKSAISPNRKAEINNLLNTANVKSVEDAAKLVEGGKLKASELYATMTPASIKNLKPESYQLLTKMVANEAFTSSDSNSQADTNENAASNLTSSNTNTNNMAEESTKPSFFEKNKKIIYIGGGLALLGIIGIGTYMALSDDKPKQQSLPRSQQSAPSRDGIPAQGLGGVGRRRKKKTNTKYQKPKRKSIGAIAV